MKSVLFIFKSDQLHILKTIEFKGFCCHKCNHNALMKHARGQNKLFQNASLLMG